MGARSFKELDCWRPANELKRGVYELIRREVIQRDFAYRDQIRDSAASAPRNIAEGFGRFLPRDFSQYLRIANGSLMETSNHLEDGRDRGYFTDADIDPLLGLARRASGATTKLLRYLQSANPRTSEPPMNPRTKAPKNRHPST
jgi:four helix bundle protein